MGEVTEMTSVRISMFPSTFSQPAGALVLAEDRVVTSVDSSALCVAGFVLEPRPSLSSPGLLPCLAPGRYSLDVEQRRNSHCDNEQDFPSFLALVPTPVDQRWEGDSKRLRLDGGCPSQCVRVCGRQRGMR